MTAVILLAAVLVCLYFAGRYLFREGRPNACPRGGYHQTKTPSGDVAPCCISCGRFVKGGTQ